MSPIHREVLVANRRYAENFGDRAELPMPPARHFAILTCMDARLDPARFAGLAEGDAHVIRNAGGRATDDAIRSLVISYKLLDTREWFVIHHTDCGMETFTDSVMRQLLASSLQTATFNGKQWQDPGNGPGSREGDYIDWLTISGQHDSVVADVRRPRDQFGAIAPEDGAVQDASRVRAPGSARQRLGLRLSSGAFDPPRKASARQSWRSLLSLTVAGRGRLDVGAGPGLLEARIHDSCVGVLALAAERVAQAH